MNKDNLAVYAKDIRKGFHSLFKTTEILHGISMEIDKEEIFGIIGPNGSGKTTLLSIFSTLIYPDHGDLRILGLDSREAHKIRKVINISTGKPNFPWSLTVKENLRHYGMLYGIHGKELKRAIRDSLEIFELEPYQDAKFENLSTGTKQRLSLAKALLNRPRLLFLDEPTTGLDPEIAMKTRGLIRRIHEQGISVVLTTHYMPEAEELCDRIAFLRKGEVVAQDTPKNLKRELKLGEKIKIKYEGEIDQTALQTIPGVLCADCAKGKAEIVLDRSEDSIKRVMKVFAKADILDIIIEEPNLEDVFLELAR